MKNPRRLARIARIIATGVAAYIVLVSLEIAFRVVKFLVQGE